MENSLPNIATDSAQSVPLGLPRDVARSVASSASSPDSGVCSTGASPARTFGVKEALQKFAINRSRFFGNYSTVREGNFTFANLLRRLRWNSEHEDGMSVYTIEDFEPLIYDSCYHVSKRSSSSGRSTMLKQDDLLKQEEIIAVDGEDIDPGVLRCFRDWRVKAMDSVMLMSIVVTCILTPTTFIWGGTWGDPQVPGGVVLLVIDLVLDVFFAAYLLMQLNVSFLHSKRRVEVCSQRKIISRLIWDPLYWSMWIGTTSYFWIRLLEAPLLLNNMKIVRIARLLWLPDSLWRLHDRQVITVLRPLFLLILSSHWAACLLACIGGYREQLERKGPESFRTHVLGGKSPSDYWSAYLMSFVEAIYMLTGALDNPLGTGSTRDKSFGSLILVSILGPVGILIISLIISSVVSAYGLAYALAIRHEENKAFISRALDNLNIPEDLQRRVFSLHYFQRMSHDHEAFAELFDKKNLSAPLEIALRIYLYHESFLHSGYFKDKDTNYILEVVRCLEDRVFVPGDYIIRRGEVGCEMFFVARGDLSVRIPRGGPEAQRQDLQKAFVGAEIHTGHYFGEIALIADCLRTAWVCAETYVVLSELKRQAIEGIWKYFPAEREVLINTITANTMRNRKDAMSRLWRTAAKRGLAHAELGVHSTTTMRDDEGIHRSASDCKFRSEDILAAGCPENTDRSAIAELRARYQYARESAEHIQSVKETENPAPATTMNETSDSLNLSRLIANLEKCCNTLLRGQGDMTREMDRLSGHLDHLSSHQQDSADAVSHSPQAATDCEGESAEILDHASPGRPAEPGGGGGKKKVVKKKKGPAMAKPHGEAPPDKTGIKTFVPLEDQSPSCAGASKDLQDQGFGLPCPQHPPPIAPGLGG